MRYSHVVLIHPVVYSTSHVLFPVRGDRQHQRYLGLLFFCNDLLESSLPFEQQGELINIVVVSLVVLTRKYRENAQ